MHSLGAATLAPPLAGDLSAALRSISEVQQNFVASALSKEEWLKRENFAAFDAPHCAISDPIQAWPTFLGRAAQREIERISTGICRLIKNLPSLIFDNDPVSISDYYKLDLEFIRHFVLGSTGAEVIQGAFGRGDFIFIADRLWCVEFNLASNAGGITEAPAWENMLASVPMISNYLREQGIQVRYRNTMREMMRHVLAEAKRHHSSALGEINVACALTRGKLVPNNENTKLATYFDAEYRALAGGDGGSFELCGFDDLEFAGDTVLHRGKPMHSIVEMTAGDVPLHVLRRHQQGEFTLHNGPATYILCNKLNLALLSEFADSGIFSPHDKELIQNHIPWTRKVDGAAAVFEGEEVELPAFILKNRDRLVLKKAISRSGFDVVVGRDSTDEGWKSALEHALFEQDWIVQLYIPSPLYPYQYGALGWQPHRAVWGAFVFGDSYGGSFLRLLPEPQGAIVAASRGASDGIVLEVI